MPHGTSNQKLEPALPQITEKDRRDMDERQAESANGDKLIEIEIQRVFEMI
jgi:hypothetical protein